MLSGVNNLVIGTIAVPTDSEVGTISIALALAEATKLGREWRWHSLRMKEGSDYQRHTTAQREIQSRFEYLLFVCGCKCVEHLRDWKLQEELELHYSEGKEENYW